MKRPPFGIGKLELGEPLAAFERYFFFGKPRPDREESNDDGERENLDGKEDQGNDSGIRDSGQKAGNDGGPDEGELLVRVAAVKAESKPQEKQRGARRKENDTRPGKHMRILPRREEPVEDAAGRGGSRERNRDETDHGAREQEDHGEETRLEGGVFPL
jgi:hypothetical protein